ncbi:TetR/AcrR family transcriptional regulator [Micromonospora sp. LOL_021]|uniref:TetR/AcrR family transcriptional regulator n=1 Tax=Micromonospora sp. LOL_021 TaxID=3345417 RepID=UPI003A858616
MAESLDRRQQIIACAAAFFASRGVAATTVRQIADEVGILSGSLYHHFDSKEAIVEAILGPYLEDLRHRYAEVLAGENDPATRLRELVRASLDTAAAHPHATEIYQNDVNYLRGLARFHYLKDVAREVQSAWLGVIEAGVSSGAFRPDIDTRVFYRFIRDAVWLSVRWFHPSPDNPTSRLADQCTAIFLDGLAARPTDADTSTPAALSAPPAAVDAVDGAAPAPAG